MIAYDPESNGLVERTHRQRKVAFRLHKNPHGVKRYH